MYTRLLQPPDRSFFLFGPRGTGKSSWARASFPDAIYLDLLESEVYLDLLAAPGRIERRIPPGHQGWVIVDEVQKVPDLLDEVHRLIERRRLKFALTGSSARKLRRRGVNLLAGRALTRAMHPLTAAELGDDFDLRRSLAVGQLPSVYVERDLGAARDYLTSYVRTYLREEVQQEGLTRNLAAFGRFLEAASFSQGAPLNVSTVARECAVERKVVEDYFTILEDLMLGIRLPVFRRRARRALVAHPKFYFFDAGVFRTLRPRGPLDSPEEIDGPALETLLLQELRAYNDSLGLGYSLHYWRTRGGDEVDFVLYGERGLHALEVKRSARLRPDDLRGLELFLEEYPMAQAHLFYGGTRRYQEGKIEVLPFEAGLRALPELLAGGREAKAR
ncbi:MAG: ATP-binding protein [Myxococcales bacterium]|nr:ATP-binding protein [Myxococcales bacterium]